VDIYITNPLSDERWDDLVARHPRASAFHQRGWLQALARTYGYEPLVLTTTPPGGRLQNGVVLCRVSSWLTGKRLVSLPFADHCEPLVNDPEAGAAIQDWLCAECDRGHCRYVELRPLSSSEGPSHGLPPSRSYFFHELDTRPALEEIFRGLHKNCIQRRIRHAEKARLSYEVGRSEGMLSEFYRLLLITRRRHQLLPQPKSWLKNLVESMGEGVQIRIARKNGVAIAGMLTLRHRSSFMFKYGFSDAKYHHLGGVPFLFWKLIEESKTAGVERIDFGRSDLGQQSLIAFKDRFGTARKLLTYYRYAGAKRTGKSAARWDSQAMRRFFCLLPDSPFSVAGGLLYRHMG
jgi:CelD/BcsL family acetyltransferase involved in cellulose biosynthesis